MEINEEISKGSDLVNSIIIPWLMTHGIRILIIIPAAYILNLVIQKFIEKAVRLAVTPDGYSSKEAEEMREDTLIHIFSVTMRITILLVALLMILDEMGIKIAPILAAAGIVGLALGFGGQYLIRDLISGLFILMENQYRIGDVVKLGEASGLVEDITLRMTTLRDIDGVVHHIPHGEIKLVSNMSKDYARINLDVGIGYDSNLEHVIEVVNRIGMELAEDPQFKEFIIKAPQFLRVNKLADYAIEIKILGETLPLKQWEITGELRKRIVIAFNREKIEIPFPQMVIQSKNN